MPAQSKLRVPAPVGIWVQRATKQLQAQTMARNLASRTPGATQEILWHLWARSRTSCCSKWSTCRRMNLDLRQLDTFPRICGSAHTPSAPCVVPTKSAHARACAAHSIVANRAMITKTKMFAIGVQYRTERQANLPTPLWRNLLVVLRPFQSCKASMGHVEGGSLATTTTLHSAHAHRSHQPACVFTLLALHSFWGRKSCPILWTQHCFLLSREAAPSGRHQAAGPFSS
mmetsp:Transcript_91165/g.175515  ORF Transcript_91165/g.175515 Transcript_91165/m.175515 type:complete len:229 (+) Transcript_91165:68-754(+)